MRFGEDDAGVELEVAGGIAQVRLSRPAKLNALTPVVIDALEQVLAWLATHDDVRCVVLSGDGRSFCAGMDVSVLQGGGGIGPLSPRSHGIANRAQHCTLGWRALGMPVIAAIHGHCYGGGLQIALGADIRIAAPDARLSVMEMRHGLVPDMGLFVLARGLVRDDFLRELVYGAREFSGKEAASLGLVTRVAGDPLDRAMALAAEIAQRSPRAIRAAKRLLSAMHDADAAQLLQAESDEQTGLIEAMARAG